LFLYTTPLFEAPLGEPVKFLDETYPAKIKGMGLPYGKNCILTLKIFDWSTRVTGRQTDGR